MKPKKTFNLGRFGDVVKSFRVFKLNEDCSGVETSFEGLEKVVNSLDIIDATGPKSVIRLATWHEPIDLPCFVISKRTFIGIPDPSGNEDKFFEDFEVTTLGNAKCSFSDMGHEQDVLFFIWNAMETKELLQGAFSIPIHV